MMAPKRVLIFLGTRPEAIKMVPVIEELQKHSRLLEPIVCATAQHRQMLDQVLDLFGIEPDIDLDLMLQDQTPASLTCRAMSAITSVIHQVAPEIILVQGDTTTAMVAAMAAFYEKIPVGHVEAGLRTRNRYDPFPEEINRRVIGVLATHHFAPTKTAAEALIRESVPPAMIYVTGNTVIDALLLIASKTHELDLEFQPNGRKMILVTAHRRENFGQPLKDICRALVRLARGNSDLEIVYPVHLNPNVRDTVYEMLSGHERIHLVDPMQYVPFVHLMNRSYLVLTDSGGIQEEAPALGKPVLVLRRTTERPEAVEAGTAKLVGTDADCIVEETERLLRDQDAYAQMANAVSPYGDGHAAKRIVEILLERV